jgi:hypothetical protein
MTRFTSPNWMPNVEEPFGLQMLVKAAARPTIFAKIRSLLSEACLAGFEHLGSECDVGVPVSEPTITGKPRVQAARLAIGRLIRATANPNDARHPCSIPTNEIGIAPVRNQFPEVPKRISGMGLHSTKYDGFYAPRGLFHFWRLPPINQVLNKGCRVSHTTKLNREQVCILLSSVVVAFAVAQEKFLLYIPCVMHTLPSGLSISDLRKF